jgi:hypothetical protein
MESISVLWNGLFWFAVLTLVVILGQLVACNLHFWTVWLHETAVMAQMVIINYMGFLLVRLDYGEYSSISWNGLFWFAVLTLAVIWGQLVACNLHIWTVWLHETAAMAPKIIIN